MEKIKLKPCPFCGGEATYSVVEAWNRRVGEQDEVD